MGTIVLKVPFDIEETIELDDMELIKKLLSYKKRKSEKFQKKKGSEERTEEIIPDFFKDEDLSWWEWK